MTRLPIIVIKEDDGSYTAEVLGLDECDAGTGDSELAAVEDLKTTLKEFLADIDAKITEVVV